MRLVFLALAGSLVGVGPALVVFAWLGHRTVSLDAALATLDRPGVTVAELNEASAAGTVEGPWWRQALGRRGVQLLESVALVDMGELASQLRVLDRTVEQHAYEKMLTATVGAVSGVLVFALFTVAGVDLFPAPVALVAVVAFGVGGWFLPDVGLKAKVEARRRAARYALSSWLDLVVITLEAGQELHQALNRAARVGGGWAYREFEHALIMSERTGKDVWTVLDELGMELGISELRNVARKVIVAVTRGATVTQTLITQSEALRAALAAETESLAERRTEAMTVPVVVFVFGLMLFVGFGAAMAITPAPVP